uniref:Rho GTPase-activating protein 7 n=1 Tax=Macrostomum lignano TaxID=282301 RepID=A0A1I8GLN3_9PLAT
MELSRREAGLFKRNDSCHCNSTGVSSVKDASDDFSSWLSQGGYSKIDSLTESHSDIKKTCLIDLTMKIVKNLSDQLTATAEAADSDAIGDGASDTETATPPRVKLRRQSKSSKAAPRPSGRSCLIKVTVASHPASLSSPLQRRRATNTGSRISFSEPLQALDTASESEEQSLNDSSTESTDTSGMFLMVQSPTRSFGTSRHLGRRCSTDDEECTQSASTESVSIVQQSRQASRRRQTDRSGNNVNNTDNAPLVSGDTKDSSKVTKTLPSVAVTAAGDAAGLKASQPCEQIKKSCLMPEPSLRLLQQQKQQEQQQQQLFTRSAESSKDSEGYSYNTVSTHCIEPWLPDLEAAGTLDGFCCADFSSAAVPASGAAGPRRQVEQLHTTTTQSATPSDSSTVMDSGEVDEAVAWDQLVFQSQLSRLRKQIYGDNGWSSTDRKPALMMPKFPAESIDRQLGSVDSAGKTHGLSAAASASASDEAPASDQLILQSQLSSLRNQLYGDSERVLIPPPVFWKSRKQKQKMPKFSPQEVQEQQA